MIASLNKFLYVAIIFFTGDSEESTGNWCFKDGVITFQNIYDLYLKHFRNKCLAIVSDCSYSGNWIDDCAKVYDKEKVLACGHHSIEKGLLLNIFASCKADEEATMLAYVKEAIEFRLQDIIFHGNKLLSSGQTTARGNFHMIQCKNVRPNERCEYTNNSDQTWVKAKQFCWARWYFIDREEMLQYVLVREDKVNQFKEKLATAMKDLDLDEYAEIVLRKASINFILHTIHVALHDVISQYS